MLPPGAAAIVNARDTASGRMLRDTRGRSLRFGIDQAADYRATDIAITARGTTFDLQTPAGRAAVKMRLIGRHNVENALTAAACVAEVFGLSAEQIARGLGETCGAPGRLQVIDAGQPFAVLVDYAHTDDALANVLTALRPLAAGKLRVLFGCGGDRDGTKRPRMARVAQALGDVVYVTSDNPRTEDPASIIEQIRAGFVEGMDKPIHVDPDRRSAITRIVADGRPGDVLLLAGKGHENYQIIGKTKHHFDDVEEALRVLQ
jgi:UDP-N-acetylmuramoyl-L-alanyl-D-glutamate--2,6-diaminopimelate ligase